MKNTKNSTGKKVNLTALKHTYNFFQKEIDENIKRVLKSNYYILGDESKRLENSLSKYLGIKYLTLTASGTDALTLSIKALNLKKDDEVLMPANVYPAVFGVALSGLSIKLADVDPSSLNLTLEQVKKYVTPKTKVIILIHLYGNPVEIEPIRKFAKRKKLFLVEDCSQAIGAEYKEKKVGSFSDLAVFSFYPTKNLGAFGDGGAIATNNLKLKKRIDLLRMYGEIGRYKSILVGQNSRFDEIQAAILNAQLSKLDEFNQKRRVLAKVYRDNLVGLPLKFVEENPNGKAVYHLFCIQVPKRDKLKKYLESKGIETGIHYPVPIHLTKSFAYLGYQKGDFPISEKSSKELLSLPMHPFLTEEDVRLVCKLINSFFQ